MKQQLIKGVADLSRPELVVVASAKAMVKYVSFRQEFRTITPKSARGNCK
jgi:hypothetical protein